jgi:hypothetical protein
LNLGESTRRFLHLTLLFGLAVAQPLFEQVGKNPEFLVAHRVDGGGVVAWVLTLSLVLPGLLMLLYLLVHRISTAAANSFYAFCICTLATLIFLPIAPRLAGLDGLWAIVVCLAAATAVTTMYFRSDKLRMFFTAFSPAVLVFPMLFLLFSPASQLLKPSSGSRVGERLSVANKIPVFFLLLDEFPLLSIIDKNLDIDSGRYPNFSRFIKDATWYRNHTTNSNSTMVSVPNLLSGTSPHTQPSKRMPSLSNYPDNLFVLLEGQYSVKALEHGSRLCPEHVCGEQPAYFELLVSDTMIVLAQIYAPPSLSSRLPAVSNDWLGFSKDQSGKPAPVMDRTLFKKTLNWGERNSDWFTFVEGVTADPMTLNYFHSMFPHSSWRRLPDGRLMTAERTGHVLGMRPSDKDLSHKYMWFDSPPATRVSRQRHLLQVGYMDHLVGGFIQRLKDLGIYEQSLVIVTSDHGTSFRAGGPRRAVTPENLVEIAGVPLFIKYPGNSPSGTSTINSQAMDIVPTVLDVLGAVGWDEFDGESLLNSRREEDRNKVVVSSGSGGRQVDEISLRDYEVEFRDDAERLTDEYGQYEFASLHHAGDLFGLVGRDVGQLKQVAAGSTVEFRHAGQMKTYNPQAGLVQLVAYGRFDKPAAELPSRHVALSVNGKISAVTQLLGIPGEENAFETLLPEAALNPGQNDIEAWFVIGFPGGEALAHAGGLGTAAFRLVEQGDGWAIETTSSVISIGSEDVQGTLASRDASIKGSYYLQGWAADLAAGRPAKMVLVFVNGEYYDSVAPNHLSQRLAEKYDRPELGRSAWRMTLSLDADEPMADISIRVFALSEKGSIAELEPSKAVGRWIFKRGH